MREKLFVIKVGGNVIEDESKMDTFLNQFHLLEGKKILIHGGGKLASNIAERLGEKVVMVQGRRVTDDAMIKIVTMVYGGLVNKNITAKLQAIGTNAFGISGADGNLIEASRRPLKDGIDFGNVGDVKTVNTILLLTLVNAGLTPIIAPLTHDGNGRILNTNADTIASEISKSLSLTHDVSLVYAFELKGVMANIDDENSLIKSIEKENFDALVSSGKIHSGMIPKLDNAFASIENGVSDVRICHFESIHKLSSDEFNEYTKVTA
jgi:acetylglutamate kinase